MSAEPVPMNVDRYIYIYTDIFLAVLVRNIILAGAVGGSGVQG